MDRPGLWPSLASLGPPGPPGLPSEIHLTLSASLTESTPIRGKRLLPHPPTHSRSLLLPTWPPRLHGGLHPGPFHIFPPCHPAQCLSSLCVCVAVCGWGAKCGRDCPSGHLAAGKGPSPQEGAVPPMPPQSSGSQILITALYTGLVFLQPHSSRL